MIVVIGYSPLVSGSGSGLSIDVSQVAMSGRGLVVDVSEVASSGRGIAIDVSEVAMSASCGVVEVSLVSLRGRGCDWDNVPPGSDGCGTAQEGNHGDGRGIAATVVATVITVIAVVVGTVVATVVALGELRVVDVDHGQEICGYH